MHVGRDAVAHYLEQIRQNSPHQILNPTNASSLGQPTKCAVNIDDIVSVSGGQPTKGIINIGDVVGVSRG